MPKLLTTPFAADAPSDLRTDIQESTGAAPNSATYQFGFPEETMQPLSNGGMPPKGSDFNGILYDITGNIVFLTQGNSYGFDSTYATKIGGYPLNARLMLTTGEIVQSTVSNNTTNPNVSLTGWVKVNSASQIFDGSLNQSYINNSLFTGAPRTTASTTFNPDGSITQSVNGVSLNTTFNSDGSIVSTYGTPVNRTVTTSFSGNIINEVLS